jgi:hypothetical protein
MANAVILEFEGVGKKEYDAVNAELGIDVAKGTGEWPPGLTTHVGGQTEGGGLVVMEVWDSQDAQAAFMESRLGAALGKVGVPAPVRVTWVDVVGEHRA